MDNKEEDLLKNYGKELGTIQNLTLSMLITSHRFLVRQYKKDQSQRLEEINKGIEFGIQQRLKYNYVDINTFFDLPLREIINKYYEA